MGSQIKDLVRNLFQSFKENPQNFFSEREIHCLFWEKAKDAFGSAPAREGVKAIRLLRHEYESVWRYKRKNKFEEKYSNEGSTAAFDFVVLKKSFVESNDHLTVVNKDEPKRRSLRNLDGIFDLVIEFKMAHHRNQGKITQSQEDAYLRDMILDARKCAQEKPGTAVIIGLSHGPRPDKAGMERIYSEIQAEFSKYNPNGKILVFLTNSKDDFGDF